METLQDLAKEYRERFEALGPYRNAVWQVLIARFFQAYLPSDGSVLDLGCGWGEFINNVRVAERFAMDLNPDAAAHISEGVTLLSQDCSQPWALPEQSLDVVFTSNFFEHLPSKDALRRTLNQARRCLKKGGRLICLGPNIRFLHGAYWDFWDHYLPLTDRSLAEGLGLAGFALERLEPRFLPYSMSQGWNPPPSLVGLYLACPPLWRIFGKQFLIVARAV